MSGSSRNIPSATKREVRQRCGFGCVVCGDVPYEYHHMVPFASDPEHDQLNLTLLCDKHHKLVTNGLLPASDVSSNNENPHNRRSQATNPDRLYFSGPEARVRIGAVQFSAREHDFCAFSVDAQPVIGFRYEGGNYMLNADLRDEQNRPQIVVVDNELVHVTYAYDVERVGKRLILRNRPRSVFIELEFDTPSTVTIRRGQMWMNGVKFYIENDALLVENRAIILHTVSFKGISVGIAVGAPIPGTFSAVSIERRWEISESSRNAMADALERFNRGERG